MSIFEENAIAVAPTFGDPESKKTAQLFAMPFLYQFD
jgi:hypothetical protein